MTEHQPTDDARTLSASQFESRCLSLIEEVAQTGRSITITKDGRPVSRLVPCSDNVPERSSAPSPEPRVADRDPITLAVHIDIGAGSLRDGPPFPSPLGADQGKLSVVDDVDLDSVSVFDDDWDEQWERKWDERLS